MHDGIYDDNRLPAMAGELDTVMAALLSDLKARGMLKSTLVVLASEFGRSPKINDRAGRDHHRASIASSSQAPASKAVWSTASRRQGLPPRRKRR